MALAMITVSLVRLLNSIHDHHHPSVPIFIASISYWWCKYSPFHLIALTIIRLESVYVRTLLFFTLSSLAV